jgi:fructokinase
VSYDVNARPAITGTGADVVDRVERIAAVSDLVKASDEDLEHLWPGLDVEAAAQHLLGLGPAAVVVTRGGAGATWFGRGATAEVASLPVEVADTIGAGDTFGAATIDALWERGRLGGRNRADLRALSAEEAGEVLAHAARAAAVTVSRPGADPPRRSEL